MNQGFITTKAVVVAVALILLGAAVFWYYTSRQKDSDNNGQDSNGFMESAREAGITFRMDFLPNEQGEKFKVNLYDHGCGVAVGDVDGDGHEDVYFVNQLGRNALYRNKGDGTFEDVTEQAGVGLGDRVCVGATFADYDNDGFPDLYVTSTRGGNVLFHNRGCDKKGKWLGFENVTKKARLTCVAHSQTAAFFDYNNDGYLDLFVANTAKWTLDTYDEVARYFRGPDFWEMAAAPRENNILYRNNGNGTFTDVTAEAGLKGKGWGGDVAVFDYNEDGYLDLLVTNMFGASQLYRNNRNGTFTEVTQEVLGKTSWGAIGCKVFDFNNDGKLDLYIVDMHSDMWLPPTDPPDRKRKELFYKKYPTAFGPPDYSDKPDSKDIEKRLVDLFKIRFDEVIFGNTFFKNRGKGKFAEVSDQANLETFWPWGVVTGDFDNNGYEDIYLPSGMGFPYGYWASALLMNNGDGTFADRAAATGIDPPPGGKFLPFKIGGKEACRSSRCAAVADFDGDGRLDIVVNNFNDHPYYFRNRFPQKNWIAFRLTGSKSDHNPQGSNRDAIGALVWIHMGKEVMVRQVHAAGGYLSHSSRTVHFGLGDRARIDRAVIRWPRGRRQVIQSPVINQLHKRTEPEKEEAE